jgi:hypothetical protein
MLMAIPVYVVEYEGAKHRGDDWIKKLGSNIGVGDPVGKEELAVPYGAVKLVKEKTSLTASKTL